MTQFEMCINAFLIAAIWFVYAFAVQWFSDEGTLGGIVATITLAYICFKITCWLMINSAL